MAIKSKKVKLGLAIVDNERIKIFNKAYLKRAESTDVISFEMNEELPEGYTFLGDVVVSYEKIQEQAKEYHCSDAEELARVIAHGVLHILGYEDATEEERSRMDKIQDKIVSELSTVKKKK